MGLQVQHLCNLIEGFREGEDESMCLEGPRALQTTSRVTSARAGIRRGLRKQASADGLRFNEPLERWVSDRRSSRNEDGRERERHRMMEGTLG